MAFSIMNRFLRPVSSAHRSNAAFSGVEISTPRSENRFSTRPGFFTLGLFAFGRAMQALLDKRCPQLQMFIWDCTRFG